MNTCLALSTPVAMQLVPPAEIVAFSPVLAAMDSACNRFRNANVLRCTQWLWKNAAKANAVPTIPKNNATISSGLNAIIPEECLHDKRELRFYGVSAKS